MNELVDPFRNINLDETEFACLKTIVFFDPNARGLTDVNKIKRLRQQVQVLMLNLFRGTALLTLYCNIIIMKYIYNDWICTSTGKP